MSLRYGKIFVHKYCMDFGQLHMVDLSRCAVNHLSVFGDCLFGKIDNLTYSVIEKTWPTGRVLANCKKWLVRCKILYNSTLAGQVTFYKVQPDQINMAVLFWYLLKSELSSVLVHYCTMHTGPVTYYKVAEQHKHVWMATLYLNNKEK